MSLQVGQFCPLGLQGRSHSRYTFYSWPVANAAPQKTCSTWYPMRHQTHVHAINSAQAQLQNSWLEVQAALATNLIHKCAGRCLFRPASQSKLSIALQQRSHIPCPACWLTKTSKRPCLLSFVAMHCNVWGL